MITETSEFADHLCGPALRAGFGDGRPPFLVRDIVVEKLPDEPTESVRDCADGLCVTEADDEASIYEFEDTPFGLHRGVRRLIEEAPHLAIAVG